MQYIYIYIYNRKKNKKIKKLSLSSGSSEVPPPPNGADNQLSQEEEIADCPVSPGPVALLKMTAL